MEKSGGGKPGSPAGRETGGGAKPGSPGGGYPPGGRVKTVRDAKLADRLFDLAGPVAAQAGLTLVDVEYAAAGKRSLVRVFIDKPGGVGLDDCEAFSERFGYVLDHEDPIPRGYSLEVSSPGLTRNLTRPDHYRYFAGRRVRVVSRAALAGQNVFTGLLRGLEGDAVVLDAAGTDVRIPLDQVASAKLVPEF